MAGSANWRDPEEQDGREPVLKIVGRCLAGWFAGCFISILSSFLYFQVVHSSPALPASTGLMWGAAIVGIFFSALGSIVGASFYRPQALGIGAAIAATLAALSMWTWYRTPNAAHWWQTVEILLMVPAAQFAALFRRAD